MTIEDDYRAHSTLTKDQIEYLIVVNSVVRKFRDAANPRGRIYEILPRSETPIFKAFEQVRTYLKQADMQSDAPAASRSEATRAREAALQQLAELERIVERALTSAQEDWRAFLRRLPDAPA
ncbi:hypothetical protein [Variovorax sp. GT1P44]|uniref:hypothetical protein n=1 Tax=Variovorax sp. GT1P44 TaxID=3443742 RepID=UPI003F450456